MKLIDSSSKQHSLYSHHTLGIAYSPNSGRLSEILYPTNKCLFEYSDNPNRETQYTLTAACYNHKWIFLDTITAKRIAKHNIILLLYPQAQNIIPAWASEKHRSDFLIELPNKTIRWKTRLY